MDRLNRSHFLEETNGWVILSQYDACMDLSETTSAARAAE